MLNESKTNLPSLTELTRRLRAAHISLRWDVNLAGRAILISNKNIPVSLRHAVWRYSRELTLMLILGDVRLCVDPTNHRRSWYYLGIKSRLYCCERCFERGLDNHMP